MLTRRHCVARYDWRGCGLSQREAVKFSLEKHIEDLEAVVEAARFDRFVLFASGGSAVTAMAYAARHPQDVSHLALYGSQTRGAVARGMTHEQVAETHTNFKILELGCPILDRPTASSSRHCTCRRAPRTAALP